MESRPGKQLGGGRPAGALLIAAVCGLVAVPLTLPDWVFVLAAAVLLIAYLQRNASTPTPSIATDALDEQLLMLLVLDDGHPISMDIAAQTLGHPADQVQGAALRLQAAGRCRPTTAEDRSGIVLTRAGRDYAYGHGLQLDETLVTRLHQAQSQTLPRD